MAEELSESEKNAYANEKRRKHKEAKDKLLSTKTKEGGLLLVHTGKGKGKTTAAMGIVARCIGHGKKVGIVQFVKGKWETGERGVLEAFPARSTPGEARDRGGRWGLVGNLAPKPRRRRAAAPTRGRRLAEPTINKVGLQ